MPVEVPCGQCVGCRLERSRQWAIRCYHEAQLHEENAFITLTYDDDHLPEGSTLVKKHYQDFMKRLRFRYRDRTIRYFQCGEYGETTHRPHYHACLFGFDFTDKRLFSTRGGVRLYTSDELNLIWGMGHCTVGEVTFQSAAYVARYIMKKVTGDEAEKHYEILDPDTGEIYSREPEYTTMSRRPGIGKGWLEKYHDEVYPSDFIVVNGVRMQPPKYYDAQQPEESLEWLKHARVKRAASRAHDNTPERLRTREKVKKAQLGHLKRTVE